MNRDADERDLVEELMVRLNEVWPNDAEQRDYMYVQRTEAGCGMTEVHKDVQETDFQRLATATVVFYLIDGAPVCSSPSPTLQSHRNVAWPLPGSTSARMEVSTIGPPTVSRRHRRASLIVFPFPFALLCLSTPPRFWKSSLLVRDGVLSVWSLLIPCAGN
jgi:hypothetical protein